MSHRDSYIRKTESEPAAGAEAMAEDLEHLHVLRELLIVFNDPNASARSLAVHVERFPLLVARIRRAYERRNPFLNVPSTTQQIAALGNRALEATLLELMEDLAELSMPVSRSA